MALQTFEEAIENDTQDFTVFIKDKNYPGLFSNIRVDRKTVPEGWYCYDIRESDDGNGDAAEIKNGYILVNHLGTFITEKPLPLKEGESLNQFVQGSGVENEFEYTFGWGKAEYSGDDMKKRITESHGAVKMALQKLYDISQRYPISYNKIIMAKDIKERE